VELFHLNAFFELKFLYLDLRICPGGCSAALWARMENGESASMVARSIVLNFIVVSQLKPDG